jgi:hypothetical protein
MSYKETVSKFEEIVRDYDGKHSTSAVSMEHSDSGNANITIAGEEMNVIKAICHAMSRDKRVEHIISQAVYIHGQMNIFKGNLG